MANENLIQHFNEISSRIYSIPLDKLIRRDLGRLSLDGDLAPLLEELKGRIKIVHKVAQFVSDGSMHNITPSVDACIKCLESIAGASDLNFPQYGADWLGQFQSHLDSIRQQWSVFKEADEWITSKEKPNYENIHQLIEEIAKKRFEGIDERLLLADDIQKQASSLKVEAEKLKMEHEAIKQAAQKTAEGVSISEAQKQFKNAIKPTYAKIFFCGPYRCVWVFNFLPSSLLFFTTS